MKRCTTVCTLLACLAGAGPVGPVSLRQAAQRSGTLIGTAVRPERLVESAYASTLAREFNLVEAEDAMKWEVIHPGREVFDFAKADRLVAFAAEHNMKVRGHTLVWHQQNPSWLTEGRFTPSQLSEILEMHIKTVVGHYRGKVFAWDVVNEAFDQQKLRDTIWHNHPGIGAPPYDTAYIERCFRWAHEADPKALLFYNDAEAEAVNPKSDRILRMVRDFKDRGVPIDGVGFQMHLGLHPDTASIAENIRRFTALGIQVHITEMDVALPLDADGKATGTDLQRQAEIYRLIATACLAHPGCTAIQTWGFTDKYSWIGSHSKHTQGAALLFDQNYRPKPAYEALRIALKESNRR